MENNTTNMYIGAFIGSDSMQTFTVSDCKKPQDIIWHGTKFCQVNTWYCEGDVRHIFKGCEFIDCVPMPSGEAYIVEKALLTEGG